MDSKNYNSNIIYLQPLFIWIATNKCFCRSTVNTFCSQWLINTAGVWGWCIVYRAAGDDLDMTFVIFSEHLKDWFFLQFQRVFFWWIVSGMATYRTEIFLTVRSNCRLWNTNYASKITQCITSFTVIFNTYMSHLADFSRPNVAAISSDLFPFIYELTYSTSYQTHFGKISFTGTKLTANFYVRLNIIQYFAFCFRGIVKPVINFTLRHC